MVPILYIFGPLLIGLVMYFAKVRAANRRQLDIVQFAGNLTICVLVMSLMITRGFSNDSNEHWWMISGSVVSIAVLWLLYNFRKDDE